MTLDQFTSWAKDNEIVITLVVTAIIGNMPESLPAWRETPQWFWGWLHDSAKTFLNFRYGKINPSLRKDEQPSQEKTVDKV